MLRGLALARLEKLEPAQLAPLLDVQCDEWRSTLRWGFRPIADRTLFLAELESLTGLALVDREGVAAGYVRHASSGGSGSVHDFYVAPEHRSAEVDTLLLSAFLDALRSGARPLVVAPAIEHPFDFDALRMQPTVHARDNDSVAIATLLARAHAWAHARAKTHRTSASIELRPWRRVDLHEAARLVPQAFAKTSDSTLAQRFCSIDEAHLHLEGIVERMPRFPFLHEASLTAVHRESGRLCGFVLASHAMAEVAHAELLVVAPWAASLRVGKALSIGLGHALAALGYETVTLTRRADDAQLRRFYERFGCQPQARQAMYVWS